MLNMDNISFEGVNERTDDNGNINYVYQVKVDLKCGHYFYTIYCNKEKIPTKILHSGPGLCPYCFIGEEHCQMFDELLKDKSNLSKFKMEATLTSY